MSRDFPPGNHAVNHPSLFPNNYPANTKCDCTRPHYVSYYLSSGQENGKSRLQQVQEEVEEVKDIMLDNINKADERSGKLGDLETRADQLLLKVSKRSLVKLSKWKIWLVSQHIFSACPLSGQDKLLGQLAHWGSFHRRLEGNKTRKCHKDAYKYTIGGAGEENKCTIYILIVFNGVIFRKVFPIVSQDEWSELVSLGMTERVQDMPRGKCSSGGRQVGHFFPTSLWQVVTSHCRPVQRPQKENRLRKDLNVFQSELGGDFWGVKCQIVRSMPGEL